MDCFSRFQHHDLLPFFFLQNLLFFIFLTFNVIIQVFPLNGKSPLGFDNKLLENVFFGHGLVFNFTHKFLQFFMQLAIFFKFFEIFGHF